MKKVLVIGAGAQGTVITWVLSRANDVSEVVLGDIDLSRMREIVETNKSDKLKVEKLNASDINGMVKLMKGNKFDLVVNATLPEFNEKIIKACYEAKADYQDLAANGYFPGGDKDIPVDELKYAKEWEKTSLKALILAGSDAGTTNIMAKEAADELDEIDSIKIKDYAITESEKPIVLWQPQTYLDDLSSSAIVWDNGYKEVPPFSGEEEYDFPLPIGAKGKVYYHSHEEPLTIPKFIGKLVRYVDFKMGEPESMFWKSLIDMRLMSEEPVEIKGKKVVPRDVFLKLLPPTPKPKELIELVKSKKLMSRLILTVDVYGKKDGKDLHYQLWTESPNSTAACEKIPGASDISYATSVSGAIFALMMLREQVNHRGVFPPEVFNKEERNIYFKGMGEWNIKIHKKVEEVLN
ncbi:saccharopine dehydrogenase NADP-binding domain-containing protein [Candidatus Aerophobetes bacterium]|nr:saccharopine dehydrogenase NADP-binding domain-containing protein [Candidatus Aerophobetes bacterium]